MSWYRSMEGSKVNTHRHHIRNDLWPLDYPSSWHCKCMNLYIFWMHTLVWLIWAQFCPNRMILKIWPLCKRSLTFIIFSPLSWQRNIVWISCNWLFYSLWLEEEFEIYFNLIGIFLSFIPIYPLTLDFMVNMVFEKMPGMIIWKFGPSSAFLFMNFQILIKWERVYRTPYTIASMFSSWVSSEFIETYNAGSGAHLTLVHVFDLSWNNSSENLRF